MFGDGQSVRSRGNGTLLMYPLGRVPTARQMWSKDADVENILSRDKEMRLFLFYSLYSCICGRLSSQLGQLGKKGVNFS